jgi:hypothetical protein
MNSNQLKAFENMTDVENPFLSPIHFDQDIDLSLSELPVDFYQNISDLKLPPINYPIEDFANNHHPDLILSKSWEDQPEIMGKMEYTKNQLHKMIVKHAKQAQEKQNELDRMKASLKMDYDKLRYSQQLLRDGNIILEQSRMDLKKQQAKIVVEREEITTKKKQIEQQRQSITAERLLQTEQLQTHNLDIDKRLTLLDSIVKQVTKNRRLDTELSRKRKL